MITVAGKLGYWEGQLVPVISRGLVVVVVGVKRRTWRVERGERTPLSKGVMNHSWTAFPDRRVAISGLG